MTSLRTAPVFLAFMLASVAACDGCIAPDDTTRGEGEGEGEGEACTDGTHACDNVCVADTDAATCGARCEPCPTVQDAAATCVDGACGFVCNDGFVACLGACIPADGRCIDLPANTFVSLTTGDVGPRQMPALGYANATGEYVIVGGSMNSVRPRPYDVQGLSLAGDLLWRNHFPAGKAGVWGPEVGDSADPGFAGERFSELDLDGVVRPSFDVYPGIPSYHQYAFDSDGGRLFFYLHNHTFSYDVVARTWTFHAPATDPAGGPESPRLLWSAMAFDAVGEQVLLFGGANVLDDDGEPGTWLYDIAGDRWREVSGPRPPSRSVSPLVVDPTQRKALLFGGDALDQLLADTWAFDFATETWSELSPATSPAPRGGHQLVFLPTSQSVVLLGGFDYTSTTSYTASHYAPHPMELWRFDWQGPSWTLVRRFDAAVDAVPPVNNVALTAAAGPGDVVVVHTKNGYPQQVDQASTWAIAVDVTAADVAGTTTFGVGPGTVKRRSGPFTPEHFATFEAAPAGTQDALLAAVVDNTWTAIESASRPANNRDWGTAVYDPIHDVMLRWSGGHSAHSGTDVLQYDVQENRWSTGYATELPLDFIYSNDQVPGQYSPRLRPWMTGHTYKSYAFDLVTSQMFFLKAPGFTYAYDPVVKAWVGAPGRTEGIAQDIYTNVLCATSLGVYAWTPRGMWMLDAATKTWTQKHDATGLPSHSPDSNTMVFDSTNGANRLLLFANADPGQVFAYDLDTDAVTALDPQGRSSISRGFFRESALLASEGLVVMGTTADFGDAVARTPVYDIAENRWYGYRFGPDALQASNRFYDVSLGLMADEARGLLWAMNTNSELFVVRVNKDTADTLAP